MPVWAKWVLGLLWDKLVPIIVDWVRKTFRKQQISKEEDAKKEALEDAAQRAQDWLKDNPGEELPKKMEDALRDAAHRSNSGLH